LLLAAVKRKFKGREVSAITTGEFKRLARFSRPGRCERRNEAPGEEYGEQVLVGAPCRARARVSGWQSRAPMMHGDASKRSKTSASVREFYPSPEQVQAVIDHCADDFRPN